MQHKLPQAEKYIKQRSSYRVWQRVVSALACVVVFCTTYALILPAITLENTTWCGQEEHTHSPECYANDGHKHTDDCYKAEQGELICTIPEEEVHVHAGDCYEATNELVCAKEESAGHSHSDDCLDENGSLVCTLDESAGHQHSDACYKSVLVCSIPEGHAHTELCYEKISTLICGQDESESTLVCTLSEHAHSLPCYSDPGADVESVSVWEKTLENVELTGDWEHDLIEVAKSQLGYKESAENYVVEESGTVKGYTRYGEWYGQSHSHWCAMFVSFCLRYANVVGFPYEAGCANWIKTLTERGMYFEADGFTPSAGNIIFFDFYGELLSDHVGIVESVTEDGHVNTIEGNTGGMVKRHTYLLTDPDILGYAVLPAQNVGECGYYEHTHDDGCRGGGNRLLCVAEEHTHNDACFEHDYNDIAEKLISMIDALPSADEIDERLLEYETADDWDGYEAYYANITYQAKSAHVIYDYLPLQYKTKITNADKLLELEWIWSAGTFAYSDAIDVYQVNSHTMNDAGVGATTLFYGKSPNAYGDTFGFEWWSAIVVEKASDGTLYVSMVDKTGGLDKSSYAPVTDGGFVLLIWHDTIKAADLDVSRGDIVTVSFDYTANSAFTGTSCGTISFTDRNDVHKLNVLESAHTSDFIDMNIYDYGSNLNTLYNGNNKYPGFQWNGGAYMQSTYNRHKVDFIDFGNSMITDIAYGSNGSSVANGYSSNSKIVGNKGGAINALDVSSYGVTNRPIGMSLNSSITDKTYDVLSRTLGSDGYPALTDKTSLSYLFTNGTYAVKKNTASVDGLFLQDDYSGAYHFNSRENHAQYGDNKFTLYEQIITPNFIVYPFGNFLPLNDITVGTTSTRVSDITSVGGYVQDMINEMRYNSSMRDQSTDVWSDKTAEQLTTMLEKYKTSLRGVSVTGGTAWTKWTAKNAIVDYFTAGDGDNPSNDTGLITDPLLSKMYNIDWDTQTNFFFGMDMTMHFMQPKDGMTGKDVSGDGNPDFPMVYEFSGDDDVWVYIDDVLFLDLSGIHRHVGGKIDFVNGKVHYYHLDTKNTGDVSEEPYKTYTFAELLSAAGKSTDGLNSKGAFADYTSHEFKFFYMERGSGSSVCRMNFNFPLLKQNSISVSKEVTSNVEVKGDPDYKFQVLKANSDGTKTNSLFIAAGTSYTIYDKDNKVVSNGITDANGVFTIKAGQRAEFDGINENTGKYYVRELLEGTVFEQYDNVTVSGASTTKVDDIVIGSDTFTGADSSVKDASNGTTAFIFNNDVDENMLGDLKIKKSVSNYDGTTEPDNEFTMLVELDGKKLPAGTKYALNGVEKQVSVDGEIALKANDEVLIEGILAGSEFKVAEDSPHGYTVHYSGTNITTDGNSASGHVVVGSTAEVAVANSENGASVNMPFAKHIVNPDGNEYTYEFNLVQVDENGNEIEGGTAQTTAVAVSNTYVEGGFTLSYLQKDIESYPAAFYYKITESDSVTSAPNDDYLIVTVMVSKTDTGIRAKHTSSIMNGTDKGNDLFENTLASSLKISKTLASLQHVDAVFNFKVECAELSGEYRALRTDGTNETKETVTFTNGAASVDLKPGESLEILNIPCGTKWSITETNADDYITSYQINAADAEYGKTASGSVAMGGNSVHFTNEIEYKLPETGGAGTQVYTTAGLLLCGIACLMYIYKRRKEA